MAQTVASVTLRRPAQAAWLGHTWLRVPGDVRVLCQVLRVNAGGSAWSAAVIGAVEALLARTLSL